MQDVDLNVADILEHGAAHFGGSLVSASYEAGMRDLTFAGVADRAARLGRALLAIGVASGDRVGTLAWNTQEHLEAYFAVPSIGAVLHTLNPRFTVEQLQWSITDAGTSVVIVDSSLLRVLAEALNGLVALRAVVVYLNGDETDAHATQSELAKIGATGAAVFSYDDLQSSETSTPPWVSSDERAAAAICYTSGTTGNPKGVVYSHRSIWLHSLVNTSGAQFGLSSQDVILPVVPMFHVMAWNLPFSAFMVGSDLLLGNRWNQPATLLKLITDRKPTFGAAVPTVWNDIAHAFDESPDDFDIGSLNRLSSGGAIVPRSLIEWWQVRHDVKVFHGCGMTETSSTLTSGTPPEGFVPGTVSDSQETQGQFLIGVKSRIVDDEGNVLAKDGVSEGELQLRGPWITGGYLNGVNFAESSDGWLPSGDIARISPQGYLTYVDRKKDIIKSGGEWISSVALEARLAGHPDVREIAVIAVDHPKWQERPVAVIVPNLSRPSAASLSSWVAESFPKYWIPDDWIFVDALPRTSVGKYDKKLLRERFRNGELGAESL
jgi:fatty-acyl-CoA synthase